MIQLLPDDGFYLRTEMSVIIIFLIFLKFLTLKNFYTSFCKLTMFKLILTIQKSVILKIQCYIFQKKSRKQKAK